MIVDSIIINVFFKQNSLEMKLSFLLLAILNNIYFLLLLLLFAKSWFE